MTAFTWSLFVLGVLALGPPAALVQAAPIDCDEPRCALAAEIDAECPCDEAANHGRYVTCVTRVVNRGVREGRVPKACRGKITGCYIRSLCGKPERVVLCDGGFDRCRPHYSEAECNARGGEVVRTCCESCTAASPTPTPAEPSATPTPGGPLATATAAESTPVATTTALAATPTAVVTPTADAATPTPLATATALPTVVEPTATSALPTPTVVLPTATPTALPTAIATPLELPTPTAVGTPVPLSPFVDIEGTPDEGPPPLTVHWTSDVSDGTPPYSYRWNFGDGSPEVTGEAFPTHVYQRLGEYTATLTVTDALGLQETEEYDILVEFP